MAKVICPRCGASVFAVHALKTVGIKGFQDLERCPTLRAFRDAGEDVNDPLECETMEVAVDAAVANA